MRFTITIPTLNSGQTLPETLRSVAEQTHGALETIVVDGGSHDATVRIASEFHAEVIPCEGRLLAARVAGIRRARGDATVLLDSDQRLERSCLERAEQLGGSWDELFLGEESISSSTWIERLYKARRDVVQSNPGRYFDPHYGVMLPRIFRTEFLRRAVDRIRPEAIPVVTDRDHQILAYEVARQGARPAYLPSAVLHHDPSSVSELIRKCWKWGLGTGTLFEFPEYRTLLPGRFTPALPGHAPFAGDMSAGDGLRGNALGLLKAVPYELGVLEGRLRGRRRS